MVYYNQDGLVIRDMLRSDAQIFTDEEKGYSDISEYEKTLRHQEEKRCVALVAEYHGQPAGYVSVYPDCKWGAFGGKGYPEIVDLGVLEKYRKKGIGNKLMDIAEQVAAEYSDIVYLGVGLHSGYGSAQRLYAKRGYIPDGAGLWHNDIVLTPGDSIYADVEDLTLYLSKKLR